MTEWLDKQKEQMYDEYQESNDIGAMLDHSETNTRFNNPLALFKLFGVASEFAWRGNYRTLLSRYCDQLERIYLNYEGFARNQAIQMARGKVMGQPTENGHKKQGGILAMLGK